MKSNVLSFMVAVASLPEGIVARAMPIGIITPICHTSGPKYSIASQEKFLGKPRVFGVTVSGCDGNHCKPHMNDLQPG
jgi:hypothetical protein